MSKHNRQGIGNSGTFVCTRCQADDCKNCVDVLRTIYTDQMICKCKRIGHDGEPVDQQVVDPFTESVHGPAAEITVDGEVKVSDGFRKWWRDTFGS